MHKRRHGGTNAPRHRMRCSQGKQGCGARFTLKRAPERYKRPVRCPDCKSTAVTDVEHARRAEQLAQDTCYCHMYPFPHRSGSLALCVNNTRTLDPTDEQLENYYSCLATPRSA